MNQLMIELGLAPDAAEEAVITAVQGLKNRAASAERHAAEVEQTNRALAQAQVEADLDHFAARFKPEAKPKWKEALIANRETALALLESLPEAPAATAPMHNRAGAATPAAGPADFPAAFQSEITAGKSRSEAVDAARAKYPELHQTWLKNGGAAHL
jgi:hypothetical protein